MSNEELLKTMHRWKELFMRRSMKAFFRHFKKIGLSAPQINTLAFLRRKGTGGVSDIADELGVSSAAASQMLDRLVQQDLILRTEAPNDRRLKQIVLTDKGREVMLECFQAQEVWLVDLAETLSPSEQEQVKAALDLLIEKTLQLEQSSFQKPC